MPIHFPRSVMMAVVMTVLPVTGSAAPPTVERLTVNGRIDPLGIPSGDLSFGWVSSSSIRGMKQAAYQVRVGTQPGQDDVWSSGRVDSERQVDVVLPAEVPLQAATRYHWQVRIWDDGNRESAWSDAAWFETGLLGESDWAGADWITRPVQAPDAGDWTDYTATVSFTLRNQALGFFLRASADARNAYMMQVNVTGGSPVFKAHKRTNGAYQVTDTVGLSGFGHTNASLTGSTHVLRFDVSGGTITTRLDDVQIHTQSGVSFPGGFVGFRTFGSEAGSVHRVKVVDHASGATIIDRDFSTGANGFSGGTVADGALQVAGDVDSVFANLPASLPLLRGRFTAGGEVVSARLYASARGLYQVSVNGDKAGDQFLAPGWTDYDTRILSQTYDITPLVRSGENAIGAALADGWHRGSVGLNWNRVYGEQLSFVAKIKLTYADGSTEWFATNPSWKAGDGPFVQGDLQDGESYNANLGQPGWDTPDFDDSSWIPAGVVAGVSARLVPQPDEPVREVAVLTAKSRTEIEPGKWIYDLGQNMVGVPRITLGGNAGETVTIRHAEELYRTGPNAGRIYTDNLRSAKATDTFTFAEDGTTTYQPTFTQHGFRYIEITGTDDPPQPGDVRGVVLASDLPDTGDLVTSHPMLNRLVGNIRWGQRGNFLSIPTDTPARDERLGWTGDINVFAPTAARLQDTRAFLSKWMDDVRDSQKPDGNIPAIVPQPRNEFDATGVGWSDAFITVPYAVWKATGDERIIRTNWEAMKKFHAFVHQSATNDGNLLEEGRSSWFSGDWLTLETVDRLEEHKVIGTVYFAENTRMMSEMAAVMGESAKAQEWADLVPQIRQAFVAAYRRPDGRIHTGTQTAYALTLGTDMIADESLRAETADRFVAKIAADGFHLRTGFLGTPWLLPALTKIGRDDLAMRLLLNETYPSWGFPISLGATTMWERWNSIRADGEFGPVDMNSFNHYAYGAVGDWMFAHLGGIQALEPGYKKSRIAPLIGQGGLTHAECRHDTCFGRLSSAWEITEDGFTLRVEIPANTTAILHLPRSAGAEVTESGQPVESAAGLEFLRVEDHATVFEAGSGSYTLKWSPQLVAPPGLKAAPESSRIILDWDEVPGATGYHLKRSTSPGGPYATVAGHLVSTGHTDDTVRNGIGYHYVVAARIGGYESADSEEASARAELLPNGGFESPPTDGYLHNPAEASWSFLGEAGVATNGSLFTQENPPAPGGSQVAFIQRNGSFGTTLRGLVPGVSYDIVFSAAQRATGAAWNMAGQTWNLAIDGIVIAAFAPGQSESAYVTYGARFTATATVHALAFLGTNTRSGDNTVFIDDVRILRSAGPLPADHGFESPVTPTFVYAPTGSAWTFGGGNGNGSGIARNGSLFTSSNPDAPEGEQVAFIQGVASLSTVLQGLTPGASYCLRCSAAQRTGYINGGQTWNIAVDGVTVASFQPGVDATSYTGYGAWFTATATSHTLTLAGTNLNGGDNTVFLDEVRTIPASAPPPATLTATPGNGEVTLGWQPVDGHATHAIRRTDPDGRSVWFLVEGPSFTDTQVTNGASYRYTVSAWDETGPGQASPAADALPESPPIGADELAAPGLLLSRLTEGGFEVRVVVRDSVPGHLYFLQTSEDLSPENWETVDGVSPREGNGGDLVFFHQAASSVLRRFYRILIER